MSQTTNSMVLTSNHRIFSIKKKKKKLHVKITTFMIFCLNKIQNWGGTQMFFQLFNQHLGLKGKGVHISHLMNAALPYERSIGFVHKHSFYRIKGLPFEHCRFVQYVFGVLYCTLSSYLSAYISQYRSFLYNLTLIRELKRQVFLTDEQTECIKIGTVVWLGKGACFSYSRVDGSNQHFTSPDLVIIIGYGEKKTWIQHFFYQISF